MCTTHAISESRVTSHYPLGSGLRHLEMFQEGHCLTDMEVNMSTFLTALAAGAGFIAGVMIVYLLIITVGAIAVMFMLKKEG